MASTPGVTYVAPNYGSSQSFRSNPNQYAIGVFDAAKNKLKVSALHNAHASAPRSLRQHRMEPRPMPSPGHARKLGAADAVPEAHDQVARRRLDDSDSGRTASKAATVRVDLPT